MMQRFLVLATAFASNVLNLSATELQDKVLSLSNDESLFVKFYAPWCGHCKSMAPTLEEVADKLALNGKDNFMIAKVDATLPENRDALQWFGIRSYPTLFNFRGQGKLMYKGSRAPEDLYKYIADELYMEYIDTAHQMTADSFTTTTTTTTVVDVIHEVVQLTESNFEDLTQASTGSTTGAWFVKFYTPWCGHCKRLAPEWQKLANSIDRSMGSDLNIAESDLQKNTRLGTRFDIKGYPTILLFNKGMYYKYDGPRDFASMKKWYEEGTYKTAEGIVVPQKLSIIADISKQLNQAVKETTKFYQKMLTFDSLKMMYDSQPALVIAASSLIALCSLLISYQISTLIMGFSTGKPKDE